MDRSSSIRAPACLSITATSLSVNDFVPFTPRGGFGFGFRCTWRSRRLHCPSTTSFLSPLGAVLGLGFDAPGVRGDFIVRQRLRSFHPSGQFWVWVSMHLAFAATLLSVNDFVPFTPRGGFRFSSSPRLAALRAQKPPGVEWLLLAPHLVHCSADLRFQNRQRLAFAALPLLPLHPQLRRRAGTQHQAR